MLIRRTIVPVMFLVLLMGCESTSGPAGFSDEDLVPVTVMAPNPADGEGLTAQGFPYKPDGTMPVVEMEVQFRLADHGLLYFDSSNRATDPTNTVLTSTLTMPPGDSLTVWLPPGTITVHHWGTWDSGISRDDDILTFNWQQFEVPATDEFLLRPRGVAVEIQMEPEPAVDYIGPGETIDIMVTPIANDRVSVLPYEDFEVEFNTNDANGSPTGTILNSSKLGARVQVADGVTDLVLNTRFHGMVSVTSDTGDRSITRLHIDASITIPVRSSATVSTDATRPLGSINDHTTGTASNGMVPVTFRGSVDTDPAEIKSIRMYEGPKLIASTDIGDYVAGITFPTASSNGLHYWDTASIDFADGQLYNVKLRVVDQATNEHVSEYTLDLR